MSFPNYFADYKTPSALSRRKKMKRSSSSGNPELMALKKAVFNPFSLVHAGIPDGKNWMSNKIRFQNVFELNFGGNTRDGKTLPYIDHASRDPSKMVSKFPSYVAHKTLDLLFFPGLNNMILLKPEAGGLFPLRYRYPDWTGTVPGDPTNEGSRNAATPEGKKHALKLATCIPVPIYAHEHLEAQGNIKPGTSFPAGTDQSETTPQFKYHQVSGFSELLHQPRKENRIEKWRLVSSGLRLSCTNNATNNAGWWEATRVNVAGNQRDWSFLPMPFGIDANVSAYTFNTPIDIAAYEDWAANTRYYIAGGTQLTQSWMEDLQVVDGTEARKPVNTIPAAKLPCVSAEEDMPNNATYCSGKVRDLHKHVFKLRPSSDEHPYKEIPDVLRRSNYKDNWPFNDVRAASGEGDEHTFVDDTFDAIHIRLHCPEPTNFLCHYVANQELVYDENSNFARTADTATVAVSDQAIARVYDQGTPALATTHATHGRKMMFYE